MPRFRRRGFEVIVQHVEVSYRRLGEVPRVHAVEAIHPYRVGLVALGVLPVREGSYAAGGAETVEDVFLRELIVTQARLAREQAEIRRRHRRQPGARLEADRAVAAEGAAREI